jgi:hypothetical protein
MIQITVAHIAALARIGNNPQIILIPEDPVIKDRISAQKCRLCSGKPRKKRQYSHIPYIAGDEPGEEEEKRQEQDGAKTIAKCNGSHHRRAIL